MSDANSTDESWWPIIGGIIAVGAVIYFFRLIVLCAMWILCVGGGIGSIVLATIAYNRFQPQTEEDVVDKDLAMRTVYMSGGSAVLSVVMWFLIPFMYADGTVDIEGNGNGINIGDSSGLTLQQLSLSSQTVAGYWKEEDPFFDDESGWVGTSGVIHADATTLTLVTNRHVLDVGSLAFADDIDGDRWVDDLPEVIEFQLVVTFASGERRIVQECGDVVGSKDLALLKVDATGLAKGRDYVLLPRLDTSLISPGDDVVAVGSPSGLEGTHTFGKISAVRQTSANGKVFQTDAAINPGNSGGPLFKVVNGEYFWIGINTYGYDGDNLSFSLDAQSVMDSRYSWFNATPQGVSDYIWRAYTP
ncbi:MAG: trypsin-like peptidase domain-containing protein [Planctomycetota bacterium]|nr:trypsin-like peptidase domain-containing protein [Planctomycetota bacterium]